jgi:hypothetical protein
METEPENPPQKAPAPTRDKCQAWWWGIYLFGTLVIPFLWLVGRLGPVDSITFWPVVMLPMGLDYDYSLLCEHFLYRLGFNSVGELEGLFTVVGLPLAYVIFYVHYRLNSAAKTHGVFLLLMLSLVLLIWGSLVGLERSMSQAIHG